MEKPIHVGVPFSYNDKWIGGSYYVLNLIHSLKRLDEKEQPLISIICPDQSQFELVEKETAYPKLIHYSDVFENRYGNLGVRLINKAWRALSKKNLIEIGTNKLEHSFDLMYPRYIRDFEPKKMNKLVWIPDLQEEFLPEFFSEKELEDRRNNRDYLSKNYDVIVFSSYQAKSDFEQCNSDYTAKLEVLRFAVTHPAYEQLDIVELRTLYNLPEDYFMVSNQFWAHKNHKVVLQALAIAVKTKPNLFVTFSGKEDDYRNPGYTESIKTMLVDLGLENNCSFLGFIPRDHQLKLMSASTAVIQPSLFEGWSTVIEDVKSVGGYVIASSIGIHKEQLSENKNHQLFDPESDEALCELMLNIPKRSLDIAQKSDYQNRIIEFGKGFKKIIDKYC